MNTPLRIGLVGAGMIGRKHAAYLKASPDCDLAAIADPSEAANAVAADFGVPRHADFGEMMASHHLDGVVIAAPNDLHEATAIAAAAHGLPMIVEKPIADDLDAAARLTQAAENAGVPLLVGHHRRYNPRARRAKNLIRDGALGTLVATSVIWCVKKPEPYFEATWKRQPGGGPVLINLIHEIDLLRFICGEIVEISAMGSNGVRGFEVEDTACIALRFDNGALGTVLLSDTAPSPWSWEQASGENHPIFPENDENPTRFIGTEAALEFPRLKIWRHDGAIDWNSPLSAETITLPKVDVYTEQVAHFARVIRGEEAPVISGADATRSLAATLAVIEAARTGTTIRLDGQRN